MSEPTAAPIFILGCERSGSTWLANIFDAHADVELWMEPFADYAELFPGFPPRNELSGTEADLGESIRTGWKKLAAHKYPLFYRPGLPLHRKAVDRSLFSLYQQLRRGLRLQASPAIDRYILLNLNSSTVPCSRQTRKSPEPARQVVKELRLNFKVELLAKVFPGAQYIVPIRHPGAQIASILRLMSRGGLRELSRSLPGFARTVTSHPRFETYRDALAAHDQDEGMAAALIPWWFINYEVLLEDLAQNGMPYHLVPHETISADHLGVVARLLAACGLQVNRGVSDFLRYSTREDGPTPSPVDTVRDSGEHYKRAISAADPSVMAGIRAFADCQDRAGLLLPELGDYLAALSSRASSISGVK